MTYTPPMEFPFLKQVTGFAPGLLQAPRFDLIFMAAILILVLIIIISICAAPRAKENIMGRIFIGTLMLNVGYISSIGLLGKSGFLTTLPNLIFTEYPLIYLNGPLLFLYVRSIINKNLDLSWRDTLHIFPFLIAIVATVPYLALAPDDKIQLLYSPTNKWFHFFRFLASSMYNLYYIVLVAKLIRHFQKKMEYIFSDIEQVKLDWVSTLAKVFFAVWVVRSVYLYLFYIQEPHFVRNHSITDYVAYLSIVIALAVLLIGALKQSPVFQLLNDDEALVEVDDTQSPKYKLSEEEFEKIKNKLISVMKTDKPYLKPALKISDVALKINKPSYMLSQVINEGFSCNFYEYINKYRIEESKRLLLSPENNQLTILAIAEHSGFNSKSVFNSVFKRFTNMTPSEFRNQVFLKT